MVLGDLDSYMRKNETWSLTYTIHKNKFKVDKRLKCKSWHHKSPGGKHHQENLRHSTEQYFHWMSPRARDMKERINKWDLIKIKTSAQLKKTALKWKENQPYGKTYLPMIPQTRVWSPKYIKNSHDSTLRREAMQLKNGQRPWTDTSPRRTCRGSRDRWKDAQHH